MGEEDEDEIDEDEELLRQFHEEQNALNLCFKNGWLHATVDDYLPVYIFPTPLHQGFVENYLGNQPSNCAAITDPDLLTFATNVIKHFSPHQLSSRRKIGVSDVQRPPGVKFQDEFYRCFYEYTKGLSFRFLLNTEVQAGELTSISLSKNGACS
jgi:hypothetical protein